VPELVIKRRDAGDRRGRDFGQLADTFERLFGQIAEFALNGLEYFENLLAGRSDFLDGPIYKCQIEFTHKYYRV